MKTEFQLADGFQILVILFVVVSVVINAITDARKKKEQEKQDLWIPEPDNDPPPARLPEQEKMMDVFRRIAQENNTQPAPPAPPKAVPVAPKPPPPPQRDNVYGNAYRNAGESEAYKQGTIVDATPYRIEGAGSAQNLEYAFADRTVSRSTGAAFPKVQKPRLASRPKARSAVSIRGVENLRKALMMREALMRPRAYDI